MNNSKITQEKTQAFEKYGHFNSTHEAYAVLQEEVDEFWDLVKKHPGNWKKELMINELTQIAAIAQRAIEELENNQIKWV
jgi:hypothetical protein